MPNCFVVLELNLFEGLAGLKKCNAAAWHDPLRERRPRSVQSVFEERLPLLHLGFGGGPNLDLRDAARELGQPLLQLLAIVIAFGDLNLTPNHLNPAVDRFLVAGAFRDRRILRVHLDLLGAAEVAKLNVLELNSQVLEDGAAAGQRGDVLQHGLAAIAVAGGLYGAHLEDAFELVQNSVASASPSTSSAMIKSGSFFFEMSSRSGIKLLALEIFSS